MQDIRKFIQQPAHKSAEQSKQESQEHAPVPLDPSLLLQVGGGVTQAPKNGW